MIAAVMPDQRRPGFHPALMCERLIRFYKYWRSCLDNNFIADRKLCNWSDDMIQSSSMIFGFDVSYIIEISKNSSLIDQNTTVCED